MSMIQEKRGWNPLTLVLILSAVFFLIFLVVSGALLVSKPSSGPRGPVSSGLFGGGAVAVVELNGVILDSKKILQTLEHFEEDSDIKAVVLRLNSPGGAVAPSQEIYEAVKHYPKPVVASMASVAASGAYYIACGTKKIFANPGTLTGSIGVIMEFANLEKLYDWAKIKRYAIKTGKFKDAGAEYREMSAEDKKLLQDLVDNVLTQFKRAVSEGRKLSLAQVTLVADGRVFTGAQAKSEKLVDELGTLQDAIAEAGRMAKIKGKPQVVYQQKPKRRILEWLLDEKYDEKYGDEQSQSAALSKGSLRSLLNEWLGETIGPRFSPGLYSIWNGTL